MTLPEFRWDQFRCYLFDIDGTLLNSRDGVHYHAFHHALRMVYGLEALIDGVPVHGNTDVGILRAVARNGGITDAVFQQGLEEALATMRREAISNRRDLRPEICPGIAALVARLSQSGKLLGVVSGNLEEIGWAKLEAADLRHYFAFGSFSDKAELRQEIFSAGISEAKRRLGPEASICFVGDTPADIAAARGLGMPVIAVATGIYSRDDLQAASPDLCLGCCSELLAEIGPAPAPSSSG